jgi:hypothetical protein|tara:strand:+ start:221 stop:463 length:243 start_codon:yes stop_codon:yes gene_type:complete
MKAQEVRTLLQGKVDADVSRVIEALAETQSVQREQLLVVAQGYDRICEMIGSVMTIAGNMKGALDQMKSIEGDPTDGPTI